MTAGQIATPYRQIRPSLLVAALIVTFGVGLLTGVVATRTVGQDAQGAATLSSSATLPVAAPAAYPASRSAISADGQDIQLGSRFSSATIPVAAGPVALRSRITADGQDIQLGAGSGSAAVLPATAAYPALRSSITADGQDIRLGSRFVGP